MVDACVTRFWKWPDVEFVWRDEDPLGPLERARMDKIYLDAGVLTPDEVRARMGLAPLPQPKEAMAKYNPYHRPAGRPDGGQFTTAQEPGMAGGRGIQVADSGQIMSDAMPEESSTGAPATETTQVAFALPAAVIPIISMGLAAATAYLAAHPELPRETVDAVQGWFANNNADEEAKDQQPLPKKPDPKAAKPYQDDPEQLRGRDPSDLEKELDDVLVKKGGWTKEPLRDGNGVRYYDGKGNSVQINKGYPEGLRDGSGDGFHEDPYVKISPKKIHVPLAPRFGKRRDGMESKSFEHEVLRWALDQDSVQNLVFHEVPSDWGLSSEAAIAIVRRMAEDEMFNLYEHTEKQGEYLDVPGAMITDEYLQGRPYTWMEPNEATFRRLNEILAEP